MPKKFIVSLVFTVNATDIFDSEDWLKYFLNEHGYVYFQGDKGNDVEDMHVDAHDMSVNVHEIVC